MQFLWCQYTLGLLQLASINGCSGSKVNVLGMTEEETQHLRDERRGGQIELDRRRCHRLCWDVCGCQKELVKPASVASWMVEVHHCGVKIRFSGIQSAQRWESADWLVKLVEMQAVTRQQEEVLSETSEEDLSNSDNNSSGCVGQWKKQAALCEWRANTDTSLIKSIHEMSLLTFFTSVDFSFQFKLIAATVPCCFSKSSEISLACFPTESFKREMPVQSVFSFPDWSSSLVFHTMQDDLIQGALWPYVAWLTAALDSCFVSHRRISGCCGLVRGEQPPRS